jgi:hypothetical protein
MAAENILLDRAINGVLFKAGGFKTADSCTISKERRKWILPCFVTCLKNGGNIAILLIIGIILLLFWALGLFVFTLGALVHIVLVVAIILIIIWLLKAVFRLF